MASTRTLGTTLQWGVIMVSRLILMAAFLVSAAPPHHADYQRCIMVKGPPLDDRENPIADDAPVSDLA